MAILLAVISVGVWGSDTIFFTLQCIHYLHRETGAGGSTAPRQLDMDWPKRLKSKVEYQMIECPSSYGHVRVNLHLSGDPNDLCIWVMKCEKKANCISTNSIYKLTFPYTCIYSAVSLYQCGIEFFHALHLVIYDIENISGCGQISVRKMPINPHTVVKKCNLTLPMSPTYHRNFLMQNSQSAILAAKGLVSSRYAIGS